MASLRKSCNEMCKRCIYDKTDKGTWRDQTEACTVTSCPLWEHRPVSMATQIERRKAKKGGKIDSTLVNDVDDDDIEETEEEEEEEQVAEAA